MTACLEWARACFSMGKSPKNCDGFFCLSCIDQPLGLIQGGIAGGCTLHRLCGSDGMGRRHGKRDERQGERDTTGDRKLYTMEVGQP